MKKAVEYISILLILWKHRISILVSLTAVTAFILANPQPTIIELINLSIGVFLLSGGASSLNHWQEKDYDSLMRRTKNRPLPMGIVTSQQALLIAFISVLAGSSILYIAFGVIPMLLGLLNVFWYNGMYTPLKRITPFAVIPGSLIGAVPALIGWTAANLPLNDIRIWILAIFLFIWQIPHFWILLIKYAEDYEKAGFASIRKVFNSEHIQWIVFPWIIITTIISLLFPLVGIIQSKLAIWLIIVLNIGLIISFIIYVFGSVRLKDKLLRQAFLSINFYLMLMMIVIVLNQIFQ